MLKVATKFQARRDTLETAFRAGFRYAELWLDAAVLDHWQTLATLALDYPFEYVLHSPNSLNLTPTTLAHLAGLYRRLGCRCLVIHQPMHDRFHQTLSQHEPAIRLGVENHKLSAAGFAVWAERNAGLTLDVEHLWKFTLQDAPLDDLLGALREFLERYQRKLFHVHLPGYRPGCHEHRPMYCSREMIFGVLDLLAKISFEGLIVSEADLSFQNANDLRMDVLLFDTWRDQHHAVEAP